MENAERQRVRDEEHLKLLAIFYYILGALTALAGLMPLIHVAIGLGLATLPGIDDPDGQAATRFIGVMFAVLGIVMFFIAQGLAAIKFLCGYWLQRRRNRTGCIVISAIICIGFPLSTVLGVMTIVVLLRDSVREMFEDTPVTQEHAK